MKKYEAVNKLSSTEFRRLTGVKKTTFIEMIAVVKEAENTSRRGKPSLLSVEDKLLMTLEYLREYRTYFHFKLGVKHFLYQERRHYLKATPNLKSS